MKLSRNLVIAGLIAPMTLDLRFEEGRLVGTQLVEGDRYG